MRKKLRRFPARKTLPKEGGQRQQSKPWRALGRALGEHVLLSGIVVTLVGVIATYAFTKVSPGPHVKAVIRVDRSPKTCDIYDVDVIVENRKSLDMLHFTLQFPGDVMDATFSNLMYKVNDERINYRAEMTEPIIIHEGEGGCNFAVKGSPLPPNIQATLSSNPARLVTVHGTNVENIIQGSFLLPKSRITHNSQAVLTDGYYEYRILNFLSNRESLHFKQ